jgi:alanyl-tRNA synthetase
MNTLSTVQIRQKFLNYFRACSLKHKYAEQSPVFINDPSLLFVNAGMNQFKGIFLSEQEIKSGYERLMNSQICVRAGGKHNDLEEVGRDSYHLTSFEMLGNWSLNDYWKEDAIKLAFEFLINECKLNTNNIYVTYFEGNDTIPCDTESRDIWSKFVPSERIIKGSYKDNFWMMSEMGVCGACTEIHYDLVGDRSVPELVNQDDPNVIEIWNIVFMEYNKTKNADDAIIFNKLEKRFVDTGMGLERLATILQNKKTIYQTDAFRYIIGYANALTGADYFTDSYVNNAKDTAYRIFADHIRTVVVCLLQDVSFDANKRGFVLRKIYRRMLTHIYVDLLGTIKCTMNNPIIKQLIQDILNYFLFKSVSDEEIITKIWTKMIAEEEYFVMKIGSLDKRYAKLAKKMNYDNTVNELKTKYGYDPEIVGLFIKNKK